MRYKKQCGFSGSTVNLDIFFNFFKVFGFIVNNSFLFLFLFFISSLFFNLERFSFSLTNVPLNLSPFPYNYFIYYYDMIL